jgi:hypothetical protein
VVGLPTRYTLALLVRALIAGLVLSIALISTAAIATARSCRAGCQDPPPKSTLLVSTVPAARPGAAW